MILLNTVAINHIWISDHIISDWYMCINRWNLFENHR